MDPMVSLGQASTMAELHEDPRAYWNEEGGRRWVRAQEQLDRMMRPITVRLLDAVEAVAGERVIDVGCGCGLTTRELAARVGPDGQVTGVDISRPMLERARTLAGDLPGVELVEADAATYPFAAGAATLITSRFGVMFFQDSQAAFTNLRRALAPDGRMVFACWQAPLRNAWVHAPLAAVAELVPSVHSPPGDAPGPFRFADPSPTCELLVAAGFHSVEFEAFESSVTIEGDVDDALALYQEIGPLARVLAKLEPKAHAQALERVRDHLGSLHDGAGLTLSSACWIVRARV